MSTMGAMMSSGSTAGASAVVRAHETSPSLPVTSRALPRASCACTTQRQPDLFPQVIEGDEPAPESAERLTVLGSFYLAYRQASVARLGPGEGGVPNPSLAMLLSKLAGATET
jgi:hypothetical protein